jgi:hypothetical protein
MPLVLDDLLAMGAAAAIPELMGTVGGGMTLAAAAPTMTAAGLGAAGTGAGLIGASQLPGLAELPGAIGGVPGSAPPGFGLMDFGAMGPKTGAEAAMAGAPGAKMPAMDILSLMKNMNSMKSLIGGDDQGPMQPPKAGGSPQMRPQGYGTDTFAKKYIAELMGGKYPL